MESVKYTTEKSRPNLFREISGGLKATITLLLVLFVSNSFGQNIDFVNAPINPIALEYKKEHFNLKGDVYGYGYRVFSKEGMLIYEYGISRGLHYLYKNGFPYADTEGKLYEFNSLGYLSKKTYASLGKQTQTYTYNTKGLITKVSNTKGYNATYEYDDKGRLSKSNVGGNIREFSYQKNGEQLIVTIKDLSKNPAVVTKHIYKNGIKIGENDNLYNLKYDKLGNISGYENAIYYSEIENRNNEISVVYTKSSYSIDPLSDCKFYINGQKADFLYKQIASIQSKDIFIYNPFTEKYYIIENAINDAKSGQKQVFSKVFINSPYYLLNRKGSSLSLGYKGAVLANTANGMRDGALKVYNAPVYLAYDKTLNQTFYGDLDNTNTTGYYPLQQISPNDNVVYLKASENQYTIVIEGKVNAKENPTHKLISSNDGGSIITDDKNNPLYYLPGTNSATLNKLYAGRKYNPTTDKIQTQKSSSSNTSQTTTTTTSSNTNTADEVCVSGDCINGFGKKRYANGETVEGFFENGKANGIGKHNLSNGNGYIGNFKDDYYQGYGVYYWKNEGIYYYGTWDKGLQEGYGFQKNGDKVIVAGYYTNGKLTKDMLTYEYQNYVFKNNCAGDCVNGFGHYKYSDNSWYYGFFKNGKLHYVGGFKNDAGLYTGEFNTEKMEGTGILKYYASGEIYIGEFANGSLNGKGYKEKNSKITNQGIWANGRLLDNTTQTTTTTSSNTNTAELYSGLSAEAKAFMETYKTNPNGLKNYVQNLHKSWEEKGSSTSDINAKYIDMYQELYAKDKASAFELLMNLPFKWKEPHLKTITTFLTDEQKAYNRQKAQEVQKKYSNSYDLKTN